VNNKDNKKDFSSAMGDLKGLLDKEGINIGRPVSDKDTIPTLTADLLDNEIINQFEEQLRSSNQNGINNNNEEYSEDITPVDSFQDNPQDTIDLPVLDGTITVSDEKAPSDIDDYISDIDDDDFDVLEFADSVEQLEETVESITQPEDLLRFEEQTQTHHETPAESSKPDSHSPTITPEAVHTSFSEITESIHYEQLKEKLHKQLSFQIELSIAELKSRLLDNLAAELEAVFKSK